LTRVPIRRALISVYDKAGLSELARSLHAAGVEIVSTGSTADTISAVGVPVTRVEDLTGFPEALDGRVKTLHPAVHAGLLADLGRPAHRARLDELGIAPFQLLVSNLYPFEAAGEQRGSPGRCVEQIDIGGPAMVRAAAKNHEHVAVITDPSRYGDVAAAVAGGGFTLEQRRRLAARAYAHTAAYDCAVASWFASAYAPRRDRAGDRLAGRDRGVVDPARGPPVRGEPAPAGRAVRSRLCRGGTFGRSCGGVFGPGPGRRPRASPGRPSCTVRPCPITTTSTPPRPGGPRSTSSSRAWPSSSTPTHAASPSAPTWPRRTGRRTHAIRLSAFGGVIAANGVVTAQMAGQVKDIFTEIVIAPGFEDAALDILSASKNLRLLTCPPPVRGSQAPEWRQVDGGLLLQTPDEIDAPGDDPAGWELKTGQPASADVLADLAFAWRAIRSVKSNAILLTSGLATVGVGMGQVNRVDAARLGLCPGRVSARPARSRPATRTSRSRTAWRC